MGECNGECRVFVAVGSNPDMGNVPVIYREALESNVARIAALEAENERLKCPVIRCLGCGGTLLYRQSSYGFEVIHACTTIRGDLTAFCDAVGMKAEDLRPELAELRADRERLDYVLWQNCCFTDEGKRLCAREDIDAARKAGA